MMDAYRGRCVYSGGILLVCAFICVSACNLITCISGIRRASVAVNIAAGRKSAKVEWNLIGARILQNGRKTVPTCSG